MGLGTRTQFQIILKKILLLNFYSKGVLLLHGKLCTNWELRKGGKTMIDIQKIAATR
jgi:hypothetical protein